MKPRAPREASRASGDEATTTEVALPADVVALLSTDRRPALRAAIATHAQLPAAIRERLGRDESQDVREAIATRADLTITEIVHLGSDRGIPVRTAIASNPTTPDDVLRRLMDDGSPTVQRAVWKRPTLHAGLVSTRKSGHASVVAEAATWKGLPEEIVAVLAHHKEATVRRGVASRKTLPDDLVSQLLEDVDANVRWKALYTLGHRVYDARRARKVLVLPPSLHAAAEVGYAVIAEERWWDRASMHHDFSPEAMLYIARAEGTRGFFDLAFSLVNSLRTGPLPPKVIAALRRRTDDSTGSIRQGFAIKNWLPANPADDGRVRPTPVDAPLGRRVHAAPPEASEPDLGAGPATTLG